MSGTHGILREEGCHGFCLLFVSQFTLFSSLSSGGLPPSQYSLCLHLLPLLKTLCYTLFVSYTVFQGTTEVRGSGSSPVAVERQSLSVKNHSPGNGLKDSVQCYPDSYSSYLHCCCLKRETSSTF